MTTRTSAVLGIVPGVALVTAWLLAWRLLSDAAGLFAPATALIALTCLLLSLARPLERSPALLAALRTATWVSLVLAVAASLSLGAFMPPRLAEWVSPALGRFGGGAALLIVAVGLAALIIVRLVAGGPTASRAPRGLLLDAVVACGLGALWVCSQVARQPAFPPPPTTAALLAPRLALLLGLGLLFALLSVLLWWAALRRRKTEPGSALPDPDWGRQPAAVAARRSWRWAVLMLVLGLIGSLAVGARTGIAIFALSALALFAARLLAARLGGKGPVSTREHPPVSDGASPPLGSAAAPAESGSNPGHSPGQTGYSRRGWRAVAKVVALGAGWLLLMLLVSGLTYFATAEDLEAVMLRNTVEWRVAQFWRGLAGDERYEARATGAMSGSVFDAQARPLAGAAVVVATVSGQAYSAYTDAEGRYRIEGVPVGNYLPRAVAPGYRQAPPGGLGTSVATVRAGQTTAGLDFRLRPTTPQEPGPDNRLDIGPPSVATADNPRPSEAVRRSFTFTNESMVLKGGLVHEPPAAMGPGPFPILLIIFPGEARHWEGVSVPLAANGYVVVSYFPVRLIDLEGDVDDLEVLLGLVASGKLSARGDASKIVPIGGSVSTAYTYLMARELENSPAHRSLKAAVQYGGLFDFFRYRNTWERGQIVIDPGISDLEYLLIAFGRPDTRPELYLRLSPRYALGPGTMPPTLLVHTGKDIIVPADQSRIADEKLTELGTPHKLIIYPNLEHYLDTSKRDPAQLDMLDQTLDFLRTYTK